ncbi:hypothetical protein EmuJ_000901200 [Echinococcus multilocularis]|uniref:Uncharacterized protein n=1 Tax=Echinococcus multilocularis TaxID=6211 RepID=A0A068YDI9_ECHMU|nr:hypothetical protein EmuJ_000901200 [Echinococcus multilocularis]
MSLFHDQLSRARVPHPEPTRTESKILLQSHPRYFFATVLLSIPVSWDQEPFINSYFNTHYY